MTSGNVAHLMFVFLFLANSMKGKTFVESREQKRGWGGGRRRAFKMATSRKL